jgi:hypothetical protein
MGRRENDIPTGQTLLKLTSTEVYHAGEIPSGGKPVPADAALQLPADQSLLIGFFRIDGTDEDYAIVVNRENTPSDLLDRLRAS